MRPADIGCSGVRVHELCLKFAHLTLRGPENGGVVEDPVCASLAGTAPLRLLVPLVRWFDGIPQQSHAASGRGSGAQFDRPTPIVLDLDQAMLPEHPQLILRVVA